MKISRLLVIVLLVAFASCKNKSKRQVHNSTGVINTISVIIDDQLWNGEVGDSIRNKFASPVIGLPQEEPLFTINQYPAKIMEGFMTDTRNIIVVKKGDENKFKVVKDQYATPQNVFHIKGKTASDIIDLIEKNSVQIIKTIRQNEIVETQRLNKKSLKDSHLITDKFGISLEIPSAYKYALEKDNFIWLKKEIVSGSSSLLIYQVPLSAFKKTSTLVGNTIRLRDSIGSLYIHGEESDTDLVTEEAYAPYFFVTDLTGKLCYETRGTWELKNDFMSGPFMNYVVTDNENNRILILEGFCYSPSKEKRDIMHELEAIIKSVAITNKSAEK